MSFTRNSFVIVPDENDPSVAMVVERVNVRLSVNTDE